MGHTRQEMDDHKDAGMETAPPAPEAEGEAVPRERRAQTAAGSWARGPRAYPVRDGGGQGSDRRPGRPGLERATGRTRAARSPDGQAAAAVPVRHPPGGALGTARRSRPAHDRHRRDRRDRGRWWRPARRRLPAAEGVADSELGVPLAAAAQGPGFDWRSCRRSTSSSTAAGTGSSTATTAWHSRCTAARWRSMPTWSSSSPSASAGPSRSARSRRRSPPRAPSGRPAAAIARAWSCRGRTPRARRPPDHGGDE